MEEGHVVWWVQIDPVPEWWVHQGKKRGRWSDAPIMPSVCTSLWGQCYDLGLLQLVRSRFSKEWGQLTTWIYWMTRLFHQWIVSSLMARAYSKMTGSIGLKLWKSGSRSMRHHFHTWIVHHRVQTWTSLRIFGMCWRRLCTVVRLSHHQYKIRNISVCDHFFWPVYCML